MKKIWLAQPTNQLSNSVFLPYSVGVLAAYAWQFSEISEAYALQDFIFLKEPVMQTAMQIEDPYMVAFSCYMWNIEYNLALAQTIKEIWKDCIIVFGGPQIPRDMTYLEQYPVLDILMFGEGEKTFHALLHALLIENKPDGVCNIAFRKDGVPTMTRYAHAGDVASFPSPYTEHYFDAILQNPKYKDLQMDAIIETNRGCPYKCLFCAWGDSDEALRQFPMEKIEAEIEWLSTHKIAYCMCADGNFGILPRDVQIAAKIADAKKRTGYPQKFETTAAKNKDDRVFEISQILHSADLNRGFSVSCQSLSPVVLQNIGRTNMTMDAFSMQLKRYRDAGITTYTDLILGLPGETYASFCEGFFDVIEAGQHNAITVNRCELLPNAPLNTPDVIRKYGIKTIRSHLCQFHSRVETDDTLGSRSEIVVETNTLRREEWRSAERMYACVYGFHMLGLLRFIAVYLRQTQGVSYMHFYMFLFNQIESGTSLFLKETVDHVTGSLDDYLQQQGNIQFVDRRFGDIYIPLEEGVFLCFAAEHTRFYAEIEPLIRPLFTDADLFSDLMYYQKNVITLPGAGDHTAVFQYDWQKYFDRIYDPLPRFPDKERTVYRFFSERYDSLKEYAKEIVWYGKRTGKTIIQDIRRENVNK